VRDLGKVTIGVLHNRGHGEGSDTPIEETLWLVARWRRGRCAGWSACQTEAEALEAAGLSE
jgi:hypothetical protein